MDQQIKQENLELKKRLAYIVEKSKEMEKQIEAVLAGGKNFKTEA